MTEKIEWRWGCLRCGDTGPADTAANALTLEHVHFAFACPKAPGLDPAERRRRKAWAQVGRERYIEGRHPETALRSGALTRPGEGKPRHELTTLPPWLPQDGVDQEGAGDAS